jgi:hypothetical protein
MSAPEHQFAEDVLISGENIDSYTAGEALTARTPVAQTGNYEVTESPAGGAFTGVVAYDVASGEEVAVIKRDCEARVEVSEAVSAGDALSPAGSGQFAQAVSADGDSEVLIANEDASGSGELVEAEIVSAVGVTA